MRENVIPAQLRSANTENELLLLQLRYILLNLKNVEKGEPFILRGGGGNENINMHFLTDLNSLGCILSNGT